MHKYWLIVANHRVWCRVYLLLTKILAFKLLRIALANELKSSPVENCSMQRRISVVTSVLGGKSNDLYSDKTVIFIDLFFATASLVSAFAHGIRRAYLASDAESFIHLAMENVVGTLLATEVPLFERYLAHEQALGNRRVIKSTPVNLAEALCGQSLLVLWSSRGTPGIISTSNARDVFVASFANIGAITSYVAERSRESEILIVCAGGAGDSFSIEDAWCAGACVSSFLSCGNLEYEFVLEDSARQALGLFLAMNAETMVARSPVGRLAMNRGDAREVLYSLGRDTVKIVPALVGENMIEVVFPAQQTNSGID